MSEANETAPAEEAKRPFQFSLMTLFVVTFVWAVFCAIGATFGLHWAFFVAGVCSFVGGLAAMSSGKKEYGIRMVALASLLLVLSLYSLPVYRGHEAARRVSCVNKLKQIGLALHNYADVHGCLPSAYIADELGKPMHSWRVLILPQLDRNDIYEKYNFDEPWNGPNNSKLHDMVVSEFHCPKEKPTVNETDTCYVAVVGPNTVFPGEEALKLNDIYDGASRTIMLVEVSGSSIHWMEPRDLDIDLMISEYRENRRCFAAFADGHVYALSEIGDDELQKLFQI